ncbi:MAG: AEC family transporter [Gammaproteobacteria bacterium]
MSELLNICAAVAPPILMLLMGGFCRRFGWLRVEADASLSILTIRVLYPCFFFLHLVGYEEDIIPSNFLFLVISGFLSICIGFAVALGTARMVSLKKEIASTFSFCSGIFNYGFFAFPVAGAIFGSGIIPKIIIFNLGVEIAIWTVGIFLLNSNKLKLHKLFNPPVISIILAVLIREIGGKTVVPDFVLDIISLLGNCAIPIGLLLIGGSFFDLLKNFQFSKSYKVELSAIWVRLLVVPALMILYAWIGYIPNDISSLQEILIIQAAMPAGIFAIVIVKTYGADTKTALQAILATMIGSLLTIPFWLFVGVCFVPN